MMQHKPAHKWYWLSNQTPDEILLFVQYDTHPVKGLFPKDYGQVPHSAFRNEDARPGCPKRQSIEVRFILLDPAPYSPPVWKAINEPGPDEREVPYARFSTGTTENKVVPPAKSRDDIGMLSVIPSSTKASLYATPLESSTVHVH